MYEVYTKQGETFTSRFKVNAGGLRQAAEEAVDRGKAKTGDIVLVRYAGSDNSNTLDHRGGGIGAFRVIEPQTRVERVEL